MSDPATILINTYPVLQNLVNQEYNSVKNNIVSISNIYDNAIRTQSPIGNYVIVNFIQYSVSNIVSPHFVNTVINKNPNILLFFSQNLSLVSFFSNPSNLAIYNNFLNSSFTNPFFGFTDSVLNPKTDLYCYVYSNFISLRTYLSSTTSQNCPPNNIIQIHSSILGTTPEITKLLSSYPLLNYLINQNYMYEIYYNFLFTNANLVLLFQNYPSLLYPIVLNNSSPINPNIINFLGFYSNLTYDFNFYPSDITLFLSTPNINIINNNLYTLISSTSLNPYLDNTIVYPIISESNKTEINRIALLYNYPSLNTLIHQNYNYQLYYNIFQNPNIIELLTFAISQYTLNLINPVYTGFPNIVTDIINFNPNLLPFFYDNPNLVTYLSNNTQTLYEFLIYKSTEIYNIKNPMTDLYNNFAFSFLSLRNLTYLLNASPNPVPTDGTNIYIGNYNSDVILLFNSNINFRYLFTQNYTFNVYYNNLYYNRILTDMLLNKLYDKNTNTYINNYLTNPTYVLFLQTIYKNPNILNFLIKNPDFLTNFLSLNESNLLQFLSIPNINLPYYDLNDILFKYDIEYSTNYVSYLSKSYISFFESSSIPNIDSLKSLVNQNYDIYNDTLNPNYIPSNTNNNKNIYLNLYTNNDQFINFIEYFLNQPNIYNVIDLFTKNPSFMSFLSNNYQLFFYFKQNPIDFLRFILFQNYSSLNPTTDLTALLTSYSATTYPLIPNKVSQYLNTSLPISGPYSGIGNNPQILLLLTTYPTLNTICTQNYNYNLFYYNLYNNNNTNIVSYINKYPNIVPLIESNPLIINFLYQNQNLVNYLNNPENTLKNNLFLNLSSILTSPYINIYNLIQENGLYFTLNNFKSLIYNYKNVSSISYQNYLHTTYDSYNNIYYSYLQDESLINFIYYCISQYNYHNNISPTTPYYPYTHILDIVNTNPNIINFFYHYPSLRTYLLLPTSTLYLKNILSLTSLKDPFTNIYNSIRDYAISISNISILNALENDYNPYYGIYSNIGLNNNMELLLTYPKINTLLSGNYNDNIYYKAIYSSLNLQNLLIQELSNVNSLFTPIFYQNPNILLFLYNHPTFTNQIYTNSNALQIFVTEYGVNNIVTDLEKLFEKSELNIYIKEYSKEFLENFQQFQTLFNQNYLNIPQNNSFSIYQNISEFIFYALEQHYLDITFPNIVSILEKNPFLLNFLSLNDSVISYFLIPSNLSLFKTLLNYSYTYLATNLTIDNPITNLYTFFQDFQLAYSTSYVLNTSFTPFNSNIVNVTNKDTPTLIYPNSKVGNLFLTYNGLESIANQNYNSNIYYYPLQNNYLIDLIELAINQYNTLVWSVHIVTQVIYVNPNILTFLHQNPRLIYYYLTHISTLEPLLTYIQSSLLPCTLDLYSFVYSNPTLRPYLETPPYTADLSNIGVVKNATPLVNDINNLSNIIYQNYNQNIYYKELYNNRTLNNLIQSSIPLQNVIALNPNIVNFLAFYPILTNNMYLNPLLLTQFLSITTLQYPTTNIYNAVTTYVPSLNIYMVNQSILYLLLNNTFLGELLLQDYNYYFYYESLFKSIDFMYLLYNPSNSLLLPIIYKNPSLLPYFTNTLNNRLLNNLLDYLQYDKTQINYFQSILNIPNIIYPLTNLDNISFKFYFMKNAIIQSGTIQNIFTTLFNQDYNINSDNIIIYEKSLLNDETCDYLQFIFDKYFYLNSIPTFITGYTYIFPNVFELLITNPNIINFLYNNQNIISYHRNQAINDYSVITQFFGIINVYGNRLTENIVSLLSNEEFYIYSTFYNVNNIIYYELGNSVSNLLSKYAIFTNLLQQYYNDAFYQYLIYNSISFQNFITAFPLSIVFNAFQYNANIISFLCFNPNLTTYFLTNASDIYYFLNNLDSQDPSINLDNVLLYNDLHRPVQETNYRILYIYLKNYFKNTLENPSYIILKDLYNQLYNNNIYYNDLQNQNIISFVYLNTRLSITYFGIAPDFLTIISQNPNILNFLNLNNSFISFLSNDTLLNTSFTNSYIYRYFNYSYIDALNTYTISNPLTNYYSFTQQFDITYNTSLYNLLTVLTNNIYDIGTTTELTDLINNNPNLEVLLNQLYNNNLYYNTLYQNKYIVELLSKSSDPNVITLLNNIYLNPNILLFMGKNPNIVIAFIENTLLLSSFNAIPQIVLPITNIYELIINNNIYKDLFGSYLVTENELFVENFDIFRSLKNQFYLHEFYLHILIPKNSININQTKYHFVNNYSYFMKFIDFYYKNIYVPNIFTLFSNNPNLINYLYYHPSLIQYLENHNNYLQSYAYLNQISLPQTDLSTFTTQFFTNINEIYALEMILYDTSFYNLLLESRDNLFYENNLLILLNNNPTLKSLVYQNYTYNYSLSYNQPFYLYHIQTPNIVSLLSLQGYDLINTIYLNPNLLVFLTNNPNLVNYLNNFNNEINSLTSLTGVDKPATNLYDLFSANSTFSIYLNTLEQFIFDNYKIFELLFSQNYNSNVYYSSYRKNTNLINLLYLSILYTYPTLIDIIEDNPNVLLFLSENPLLVNYFLENIPDLQRFVSVLLFNYPIINIYSYVVNNLSYLKSYLSQIPIGLNSGVGTTPDIITLLNQNSNIESLINQNYNQNVYYIDLYNNSQLVQLLTTNATLRTAITYNNNILQFLNFNPLLLNNFFTNPSNLNIFLTNNGILDPITNLYDFVVTYLPSLSPLLNESLTGIYSTIGTKDSLTKLLNANPKLNALIQQNYNYNIYYLDLYNNDSLVTLLSTPSSVNIVSLSQQLLNKIYLNPNILNYLNNNPNVISYFLSFQDAFEKFINLSIQIPLNNIDNLMKTNLPYLTEYLTQYSIGLESNLQNTQLTTLLQSNSIINNYANSQNYIIYDFQNLYYKNLYNVSDLVTLLTNYSSQFNPFIQQNPNIINFLASNPTLCSILLQSTDKINYFLQLPNINDMSTNIYDLIKDSKLYGNIDSLYSIMIYNYFQDSYPLFYNDYLFNRSFESNVVYSFMYYALSLSLPNSAEIFLLNPNFINFLALNPALTTQLNLEHLKGYDYNIINILSISELQIPTNDITTLITNYINSSLNITLSIDLLNQNLPKAGINSYIGTNQNLSFLLSVSPELSTLTSQNYNENIYYKSLYYNPYLVSLLLTDYNSNNSALLNLIYQNNVILNFLGYNPKLVIHLNANISDISLLTANPKLYLSNTNIYNVLYTTSLRTYLNTPIVLLSKKYDILKNIIEQSYNNFIDNNGNNNNNLYYNALQNSYVSELIYYGIFLHETNNIINILDIISSNMNVITFLYNNLELTKYLIQNELAYIQFIQLSNLNLATTNITNVVSLIPSLAIYLNKSLTNGGLTSNIGTTPALTTLLTNNTILNNIVSTNYIDNIYYINLYNTPSLVTLINNSTQLLQYIYLNPNIINFLAQNVDFIEYMLTNTSYVTSFLNIENVGVMSKNLDYQYVLYNTLLNNYLLLKECVEQKYNLLPNIPYLYKYTLNNLNILNFIYFTIQNVTTLNLVTDVIYGNPNFINFLFDNPNLVTYFTQNIPILQSFMTLAGLNSPIVDLYELVIYYGTQSGNQNIISQLNQSPSIVGINSGIGTNSELTTLIENNTGLKSLINQNYNKNIYYLYLITYPDVVELIKNNFNLLYSIYQNPNIITFLGNNPDFVLYLLSNPYAVELFLSIENINNPMYDIYTLIQNFDTQTTNDAAIFQSLLNRSFYVLLDTYPNFKTLVLQNTNNINITTPLLSTINYHMNNTYFYAFSTNQSLVDFIYINLSNPSLPNIINKILKNPNIITFLSNSDISLFTTYINGYYKDIISNPLIENPANDINELNIPYFNPNPTYFENAYYNKNLYTLATENGYYNNILVKNLNIRNTFEQRYTHKMYEYNLSAPYVTNNNILQYIMYVNTFPYLNFIVNTFNTNPNIINFLANNPYLLQNFIDVPANFSQFSSIVNLTFPYEDIENLITTLRPSLIPYLSKSVVYNNIDTDFQTLVSQKYNNGTYRNVLYSNIFLFELFQSNTTFQTKVKQNPNILLFLHKNPDFISLLKQNSNALSNFLSDPNIINPVINLYNYFSGISSYVPYLNIYIPLNISYTDPNLNTLISTYPNLSSILQQKYIGNSETNIYYDNLYNNSNLVTLLLTYPSLVTAIESNPNIINFLSKNCVNPISSGITSLVDYLQLNPLQVPVFIGLLPVINPMINDLYTIYLASIFSPYLTINNIPLLYSSLLYSNVLAYVNQDYNNDMYFNAFQENCGTYDFINYVYNIYLTITPVPFRNIFTLLNTNPNILLYLRESNNVGTYLTNPVNYTNTVEFMNISLIEKIYTNIQLMINNTNYLNPSPTAIPAYTTPDLTTLLNNDPTFKSIIYQNYNSNHYYNNLYNNPNVVTLLLKNTFEYAALMPVVYSNPTLINFFCMYPSLVSAIYSNTADFVNFISITGLSVPSNNLISLVSATYLNVYMNQEYNFIYNNYYEITNLVNQPYNEAIYYKAMNQNRYVPLLLNKYASYSPSIIHDVVKLNPNMITFLASNPNLTLELYNNSALYYGSFITLFGTYSLPNANNSPTTDLYGLILSIPSLSPYLNPVIPPFPAYGTPQLTALLAAYPLLNTIITQNYNSYIYYKNLYNVPSLVNLLTLNPTLIPLIYNNPNIMNVLSYSLYMVDKLSSTLALRNEFITYSTGKNPTYPNVTTTSSNYLYSLTNLYSDNSVVSKSLWKYVNTAYLGYGTLNSQFTITPLFYAFSSLNTFVGLPYNEDLFYRALYQNVATGTLQNDYIINFLGYVNKNYNSSGLINSISLNPHILTFLYQNNNYLYNAKLNTYIVEQFIYNNRIALCLTDLYNMFYNTIPLSYYNNNLEIPYNMYSINNLSPSLKTLFTQTYNYVIYYSSISSSSSTFMNNLNIQFLLYCISNVPIMETLFTSNPNLLLFFSNNPRMIQYMMENPLTFLIFILNPNSTNVEYNLVQIVISTVLENYLDNNIKTLLTTTNNQVLELIDVQYNNNIVSSSARGSLAPQTPQSDYYMVNLYYDAIMKYPKIAQLINYALDEYSTYNNNLVFSMSDYPNILTDIIYYNPNVMGFLEHNPNILNYILTPVTVTSITLTPLYRFLKIPIINAPEKDITSYIENDVLYSDFVPLLNKTIYVPSELAYLNSQIVVSSNAEFYEFLNENYNSGIYVINLFQYSNQIISIFIANPTSLFYNAVYANPNIINFLVYYNDVAIYLNNNPSKVPIFINIPNITNVMLDIYDTINNYSSSGLLSNYTTSYLGDNSNIITYYLNTLLEDYPLLNVLFNANNNYNNIIYESMILCVTFENKYVNLCYLYPYIMDISLKNIPLIEYMSNNSYGDDSLVKYIDENPTYMIYEMEKLTNHLSYVINMDNLMNQNYNYDIYKKVFYYNTVYGSISKFITDVGCYMPLETNMNILLFIYNNPRLLEFYYTIGISNILVTNTRFNTLFNLCTSPTTNITSIFQSDIILKHYLNSDLVNGGIGSVPLNPDNINLVPLLNANPVLNGLVSQNYIFNMYFLELNNSIPLVNMLYKNMDLLNMIYENPNIINFLYNNPALIIFLNNSDVCGRSYVDLLTTNPNITNIYENLFTIYEKTSLQAYLTNTNFVPPLPMYNFLNKYESIKSIVEQQYNGNIYYNSINKSMSMITLLCDYPNVVNYINLNPNIINFMSQNPKFIDFYKFYYGDNISNLIFLYQLTSNVNTNADTSYGIIDVSTIQNASNPIIDLYKFYYQKLPQYLNNNPNILGFTNGFGYSVTINNLLKNNGPLDTLIKQNYNYNIYKIMLLFNATLVTLLGTQTQLLFYFVYKNPNMLNFLFYNNELIKELIENPSYDNFFVTLTFCQNPVLNLYNAIYSYDISNTTNPIQLSDYFEKTMFLDLIGNIGPDSILIDTSSGYP